MAIAVKTNGSQIGDVYPQGCAGVLQRLLEGEEMILSNPAFNLHIYFEVTTKL